MGKVLSVLTRPIRNYNIENRAHKIISKDKPALAPKFEANIKEAEKILKENPDSFINLLKKDLTLDTHLKDVYVKSYDPISDIPKTNIPQIDPNRPLPSNRHMVINSEFGYNEPNKIPAGRCTLRQVLKLLSNYQTNPDEWDRKKEALNYNIPEETLSNIIHYFRVYNVYIPDKKDSRVVFGAPKIPKKHRIETSDKENI